MLQERVKKLTDIRNSKSAMSRKESELSRPITDNVELIGLIYGKLGASMVRTGDNMLSRRAFLYVILYYFSPSKLSGGKIHPSVMNKLMDVMGLRQSLISHCADGLYFQYQVYKDFRDLVDVFDSYAKAIMVTHGVCERDIYEYENV